MTHPRIEPQADATSDAPDTASEMRIARVHAPSLSVVSNAESQTPSSDDLALAARICEGDEAAFDAMFREYAGPLHAFAESYLRSADDAADVVQDVFVKLWQTKTTWILRGSIRAYLYTATRNHVLNRFRHGRVRERADEQLTREASLIAELVYAGDEARDPSNGRLERCERALAKLSEKHRQVLLMRWQHDLTYAEIATILDVPVKTVGSRVTRAVQLMREFCLP